MRALISLFTARLRTFEGIRSFQLLTRGSLKSWIIIIIKKKNACTNVLSSSFSRNISSINEEIDKIPLYNHFTQEVLSENLKFIIK